MMFAVVPVSIPHSFNHTTAFFLLLLLAVYVAVVEKLPGVSGQAARSTGWIPDSCDKLDCPEYSVVATYDNAQLRCYKAASWVTTHVHRRQFNWAVPAGFHRLLKYIRGENDEGTKLEMTAPVLVEAELGVPAGLKRYINESFFIPYKYQDSPPTPTCDDVNTTKAVKRTVFTMSFGGYATSGVVEFLARGFIRNLEDANLTKSGNTRFFVAIYDSPFKVFGRYNEIWVPANESRRLAGLVLHSSTQTWV